MNEREDRLRHLLRSLADDVPIPWAAPPELIRRATRRRVETVVGGLLTFGLIAIGLAALSDLLSTTGVEPQRAAQLVPKLVSTVRLPSAPTRISVGAGSVWVVNEDDGSRSRIDPQTEEVGEGAHPAAVDLDAGSNVLVAYSRVSDGRYAVTISDEYNRVVDRIQLPGERRTVGRVAVGLDSLWVARWSTNDRDVAGELLQIDLETRHIIAKVEVNPGAGGVALGEGALWVTDADIGVLQRIDPESHEVTQTRLGGDLVDVTVGFGSVWVSDVSSRTVFRLDPTT
ncbi:MAG: hypothetical protein ABR518_03530, partial [Actinomycetota bacterium]